MCTVYSKWYDDTVFAVAVTPELGVRLNISDSLEGSCQAGVSKNDGRRCSVLCLWTPRPVGDHKVFGFDRRISLGESDMSQSVEDANRFSMGMGVHAI